VISYTNALQEIVTLAERHGAEIRAIRSITPSLEDAFVQMTGMDVAVLESNKPQSQGGPRA
jgi:tmRNA-binding protein